MRVPKDATRLVLRFQAGTLGELSVEQDLAGLRDRLPGPDACFDLAGRLARCGEPALSKDLLRRAVAARPDDPEVLNRAAWYLLTEAPEPLRDPDLALDWARRAVAACGDQERGHIIDTLAVALWQKGLRAEAAREAGRAARLQPQDEGIVERAKEYAAAIAQPAVQEP